MGKLTTFVYAGKEYTGKVTYGDNMTVVKIVTPEEQRGDVLDFPPGAFRRLLGGVQDMTTGVDFTKHLSGDPEKNIDESKMVLQKFVREGITMTGKVIETIAEDNTVRVEVTAPESDAGRIIHMAIEEWTAEKAAAEGTKAEPAPELPSESIEESIELDPSGTSAPRDPFGRPPPTPAPTSAAPSPDGTNMDIIAKVGLVAIVAAILYNS